MTTAPTPITGSREAAMCTDHIIEFEQGTTSRSVHPHNGYYAGDFSGRRPLSTASLNELFSELTALRRTPFVDDPS